MVMPMKYIAINHDLALINKEETSNEERNQTETEESTWVDSAGQELQKAKWPLNVMHSNPSAFTDHLLVYSKHTNDFLLYSRHACRVTAAVIKI